MRSKGKVKETKAQGGLYHILPGCAAGLGAWGHAPRDDGVVELPRLVESSLMLTQEERIGMIRACPSLILFQTKRRSVQRQVLLHITRSIVAGSNMRFPQGPIRYLTESKGSRDQAISGSHQPIVPS